LDWRVPPEIPGFFPLPKQRVVSRQKLRDIRNQFTDMFEGYESANPTKDFWTKDWQVIMERVLTGEFSQKKVLRHRILGHLDEDVLEQRLLELGEKDTIHKTPTFGAIFRLFFRPTPSLQLALDHIYQELNLKPGLYTAV
jgi:hypothetical protein